MLAPGRSKDAAFAISVSAFLVTADEQMRFETRNLLTIRGYSQSDVQGVLAARNAWIAYLHRKGSRNEVVEALRKAEAKAWFDMAYLQKHLSSRMIPSPIRTAGGDYPIAPVQRAKVPLLFSLRGFRSWVPVGESVKRLQSLAAELPNIQYAVVDNANHEMRFPGNETLQIDAEATRKEARQAPAYFILLASWIARHVAN